MTKDLTTKTEPVTMQNALITLSMRDDVDPDKIEKLMNLQSKMEADQAEKEYFSALTGFQEDCPIITKKKKVNFSKTSYAFAPLDEIIHVIKPIMARHKLAYTFNVEVFSDDQSKLITTISHSHGHREHSNHFFIPMADGGSMNQSQRIKSALSYAKRAGLENALGIVCQDEDDDALRATDDVIDTSKVEELSALCKKTSTPPANILSFLASFNGDGREYPDFTVLTELDYKKVKAQLEQKLRKQKNDKA